MKVKRTHESIKHMAEDELMLNIILEDAGLKDYSLDESDNRIVYDCKEMPRDMKQAFIFWEEVKK